MQSSCRLCHLLVCLWVCLYVQKVYCGKKAEWIRMPFGVVSAVGLGIHVLNGGPGSQGEQRFRSFLPHLFQMRKIHHLFQWRIFHTEMYSTRGEMLALLSVWDEVYSGYSTASSRCSRWVHSLHEGQWVGSSQMTLGFLVVVLFVVVLLSSNEA